MFKIKGFIGLGACLLMGMSSLSVQATGEGARAHTNQLIIQLDGSANRGIQAAGAPQSGLDLRLPDGRSVTVLRQFDGDSLVVQLPEELSLEESQQIAEQMASQAGIAAVYPDKRFTPAFTPNDTFYQDINPPNPDQWHLFENIAGIRMDTGWDLEQGDPGIIVAVIDTGIIPHLDMDASRQVPGYDFFSDAALDNDGTPGRDADPTDPGDATSTGDCGPGVPGEPSSWHGLSVASVILATSNNNLGIAGIAFQTDFLPIRVLGRCGGTLSDVADAVRWAAGLAVAGVPPNGNPADVINLSLSGSGACSQPEQDAINAAVAAGSVVVTAAGNESGNVDSVSPANCDNVIVVGAITRTGDIASYTNVGLAVDLTAPGGEGVSPDGILVLSNDGLVAVNNDILVELQGTSFTTAMTSGVAALMLATNGALTPALLEDVIKATTRAFPVNTCDSSLCGTGVLDATAALVAAADPSLIVANLPPAANAGGPYSGSAGSDITFDGSGSSDPESFPLSYSWDFGDDNFGTGVNPVHNYAVAGDYTVTLVVNDGVKDSTPSTSTVTVSSSGNSVNFGSGGGGGCSIAGQSARFDPIWGVFVLIFVVFGFSRWRTQRD